MLRFYEDLEYAEIAAILRARRSTVRSHVHRALAALRAELTSRRTAMNERRRLEEGIRDGLQRRAEDVDTSAPLVAGHAAAARRRRRG